VRLTSRMSASGPLLIERRNQYLEYLLDALRMPIHRRVREWMDVILADKKRKPQALKHFQEALAKVSGWNSMRVTTETSAVVRDDEDVEYLPKLIHALISVETKLFLLDEAVDVKDVAIRVPSLDVFVHQCFIEAARQLWKNIALFDPALSKLDQQKNYVTTDGLIAKAIKDAVRHALPIKDIVQHVALPMHTHANANAIATASSPSALPSASPSLSAAVAAASAPAVSRVPLQATPIPPMNDAEAEEDNADEDDGEYDEGLEYESSNNALDEEEPSGVDKPATANATATMSVHHVTPEPEKREEPALEEAEFAEYEEEEDEEEDDADADAGTEEVDADTKTVTLQVPASAAGSATAASSIEVKKKSFY